MTDSPRSTDSLIAAQDISVSFSGRQILDGVSLELRRGRVVTLIGPNGAGKTTLVRSLLGLLVPDSGSVSRHPELRIGYMPQRLRIERTLPLTVARFLQLCRRSDEEQIDRVLTELRIAHLEQSPMNSISGGEMQRALLARALLNEPHLLILDEPAQGVDLAGQVELYQLIGKIRDRQNCGVLMISHDLQLVMSATDEVVCLNHHVCCHGEPEQVSSDPAFVELFGADISRGLALYTHDHNHEHDLAGQVKD